MNVKSVYSFLVAIALLSVSAQRVFAVECRCVGLAGNFPGYTLLCGGEVRDRFLFGDDEEKAKQRCLLAKAAAEGVGSLTEETSKLELETSAGVFSANGDRWGTCSAEATVIRFEPKGEFQGMSVREANLNRVCRFAYGWMPLDFTIREFKIGGKGIYQVSVATTPGGSRVSVDFPLVVGLNDLSGTHVTPPFSEGFKYQVMLDVKNVKWNRN